MIELEQKLVDYMAKKNYTGLKVEVIDPVGCCADSSELCIGFVREKDMDDLRAKALRVLECEQATLFIMCRGIEIEDSVTLGLRSFLGAKDITAQGMRAWKF